jgi:hypothetical protein
MHLENQRKLANAIESNELLELLSSIEFQDRETGIFFYQGWNGLVAKKTLVATKESKVVDGIKKYESFGGTTTVLYCSGCTDFKIVARQTKNAPF